MLTITQAVTRSVRATFDYNRRSRRSEYWWTWLFVLVLVFAISYIDDWMIPVVSDADMQDYSGGGWKEWLLDWKYTPFSTGLYYLTLPTLLAVTARRMHDVGRRAWIGILPVIALEFEIFIPGVTFGIEAGTENFVLSPVLFIASGLMLIILVLGIYSFVLCLMDSHRTSNRFGPSPKYSDEADAFD